MHRSAALLRPLPSGRTTAPPRRINWGSRIRRFLKLFAQCLEGLSPQRRDGAAEAVQNIALEESPDVVRQVLRPGGCGKGGDSFDRRAHVSPC